MMLFLAPYGHALSIVLQWRLTNGCAATVSNLSDGHVFRAKIICLDMAIMTHDFYDFFRFPKVFLCFFYGSPHFLIHPTPPAVLSGPPKRKSAGPTTRSPESMEPSYHVYPNIMTYVHICMCIYIYMYTYLCIYIYILTYTIYIYTIYILIRPV